MLQPSRLTRLGKALVVVTGFAAERRTPWQSFAWQEQYSQLHKQNLDLQDDVIRQLRPQRVRKPSSRNVAACPPRNA